ncbi:phosphate regulon sensor histidine kinase PhoR [Ottowia sp.]|uniref:phosphate regulon sensor histidine kinase PhoR n=1 Tax=Ottowia sp. TaxID=1898956 RepID=UPI00262D890E|nr:phosphate regulon sensor histidine kinase PhoR [Ottowia sp.]
MIARILFLAAVLLLAGLTGWWLGGWPAALGGVVLGSLLALGVDSRRGLRFNHWLMAPDAANPPAVRGLWGEAAYRVSKVLRAEQRKAQDSAQRMEAVLSAIQASPNGVVLLDADGRMEWFNHTAAQHFGFQSRRDLLQHVVNLVREPAFVSYFNAGDFAQPVQMLGRPLAGSQPARLSVQIHPYGEGRKLLLSNDVTATARAEAMRRDFVANVSHEIRTPLTVLAGFVETMQTLPLGEQERESYLQLMAAQARRMQTLVDDLLTLSRLEGSPLPGDAERVDLVAMMRQCEDEARGLSGILHPPEGQPQQISFGPAPDFALAGAAGEVRSAVSNLIINAVRYTPAGGRIGVGWRHLPDGAVRLEVTDTGPGIAPEHLPRLAERFYRVDRSRSRESGGTGLGLAIAKHVAQRHGGELQITSQLGKGSCFALLFPAYRVRPLAVVTPAPATAPT